MKSVLIKNDSGMPLVKVIDRKNGLVTLDIYGKLDNKIDVEVRDDKNCKVIFERKK